MFAFAWPWLWLALPLPLLSLWRRPPVQQQLAGTLRVPFPSALAPPRPHARRWRMVLAILAWLLLVAAAARPQWLDPHSAMVVSGRDLMLAVDISPSMQIDDLRLNGQRHTRLEVLQDRADAFLQGRHGDRLGLILFGAQAYLHVPLTFDRDTVRQLLAEAEIGFAGNATAIGDAIGLAVKRLRDSGSDDAAVILLTDGANNAGELDPLEAAELARLSGIRLYTIGIGADSLQIEGLLGREQINPSADLDEALLRQMAALTGGEYFRARDTADLDRIHAALDILEPTPQAIDLPPRQELYPWPLAAALLLGLVVGGVRYKAL